MTGPLNGAGSAPLLVVDGLSVRFGKADPVVKTVDFTLHPGQTLAIVGESGSGKSVTSLAVLGLIAHAGGEIAGGRIDYRLPSGQTVDIASLPEGRIRTLRGSEIAMIFQEPMTALNPVFTVGEQIIETILEHRGGSRGEARKEAVELLRKVRLPDPEQMAGRYPHQLSGGMRQRVVIAMALSCRPRLLIADEPTTALDVTVQAQIIELIRTLQEETGVAVIFITHDMGIVAELADHVMVMYQGRKVEEGPVGRLFSQPEHPYTRMLLSAVPRLGSFAAHDLPRRMPVTVMESGVARTVGETALHDTVDPAAPMVRVDRLCVRFDVRRNIIGQPTHRVHAAEAVSFDLYPGETLALVGESGSGKSTIGRAVQSLVRPSDGVVQFEGQSYAAMTSGQIHTLRQKVHTVYQDPMASLNPRLKVGDSIAEPIRIHRLARDRKEIEARVRALLVKVGLKAGDYDRYPHEFSGGQRQRICVARALASEARLIIADEAVSALDVSVRSQVVRLLMDLQAEERLSYLFISHDMAVVEQMAHRVAVIYLGQIVEIGPRRAIIGNPQHPYTQRLIDSVPVPVPDLGARGPRTLEHGDVPSPMRRVGDTPHRVSLREVGQGHFVADPQ